MLSKSCVVILLTSFLAMVQIDQSTADTNSIAGARMGPYQPSRGGRLRDLLRNGGSLFFLHIFMSYQIAIIG